MTWLGLDDAVVAARLGLPRVAGYVSVPSTMDVAHALAADGAAAGTLVITEEQTAGRGRAGRVWTSRPGDGLWMTLIERPRAADALAVLSLRVGLHLAPVLERWTSGPVRLKWPNDLYVGNRKLAGVLIEARWRGAHPDWVAIGLGINLSAPVGLPDATGLGGANAEARRGDAGLTEVGLAEAGLAEAVLAEAVLAEAVPAVRAAAFASGPLTTRELDEFARRDLAVGQRVSLPAAGLVRGISPAGELLLETPAGVAPFRVGSLVFANT